MEVLARDRGIPLKQPNRLISSAIVAIRGSARLLLSDFRMFRFLVIDSDLQTCYNDDACPLNRVSQNGAKLIRGFSNRCAIYLSLSFQLICSNIFNEHVYYILFVHKQKDRTLMTVIKIQYTRNSLILRITFEIMIIFICNMQHSLKNGC